MEKMVVKKSKKTFVSNFNSFSISPWMAGAVIQILCWI